MCRPTFFDVEYEINPWMHTNNGVDKQLALTQWQKIYDIYTKDLGWQVELIDPVEGLPDMVFTANGGLVINDKVALPNFRQADRQGETAHFTDWFKANGYQDTKLPKYNFEGEGDALLWKNILFAGFPWRSDRPSYVELANYFGIDVASVQLADARFYHLDTCFTPINQDTVALFPGAFTEQSLDLIRSIVPHVIEASEADAVAYGLNAMCDGQNIVLSDAATGLIDTYRNLGLNVYPTPISEFQKSGGGVKCLTLELR